MIKNSSWGRITAPYIGAVGIFCMHCAPMAVTPLTPAKEQQAYDRERYQAKIRYDASIPQAATGFFRLGRAYSASAGMTPLRTRGQNPRDLDTVVELVNQYTEIQGDFATNVSYRDPRLLTLPIIVPQNRPHEGELESLALYLMQGGFILDGALEFEFVREALEKYGQLVWQRDARIEWVPANHPHYRSFFSLAIEAQVEDAYIGVRGIFIGNRLVMTAFNALDPYYAQRHGTAQLVSESAPTEDVGVGPQVLDETQLAERQRAINQARVERFSDVRLQQLVVNTVVYALTQEGAIARPTDP